MELLILVAAGTVAGILAGLFGVGGGLIIVPALVLVFSIQGMSADIIMHLALGTSLATIITTALSSIRAHHKRGAINWLVFKRITPGILVGAAIGALIASYLTTDVLRFSFACFLVFIGTLMAINKPVPTHRNLPGLFGLNVTGGVIGIISSLMGVGGGSMSVPFLTWCNMAVRNAVGTSAAIGLPIAVSGALSFMIAGWGNASLPSWSLGFIYLPAYVVIVVAGFLFAPVGASLAHRLPPNLLKKLFAAFLYLLAIKLFLA